MQGHHTYRFDRPMRHEPTRGGDRHHHHHHGHHRDHIFPPFQGAPWWVWPLIRRL